VAKDEPPDPVYIGLLGPDAGVQPPDDVAELIEQSSRPRVDARSQCLSLPCFHAVGLAPPCTTPFLIKALPASPTP